MSPGVTVTVSRKFLRCFRPRIFPVGLSNFSPSSDTLQPFLPVLVSATLSHRRKFLELHSGYTVSLFASRFSYFSRASLLSVFFSRAYVSEKRKISKFQTSVRIIQESRVYFFFKFFSWIRRLLRTFLLKIEKFKEIYRHTDTLTYMCSCISLKSKLNYQNK